MKSTFLKHSKKILVGAVLAIGCLGMASVAFAEAKAIEFDTILKGCYTHTMRNEFYIRSANMYKDPVNGWGEIIAREESGMDGSVTKTWLIGEVKDGPRNDVLFHIQRQVVQKLDANGKTISCKDDDVNYSLLIYPQNEYSFNVVKPKGGRVPAMDSEDWALFSGEADEKDSDGHVTRAGRHQFSGCETDQTMFRISAMNLLLHGIEQPDIRLLDSVSKQNTATSRFDLVLANPPFTGSVDAEDIAPSLKAICDSKQTELLFVALFLRMLKVGGRCACIVPNGVLFRTNSKAYRQLRQELVEHQQLRAIIYMPSGVFKPYSGVSTAVLVFTKTDAGGTDKVWLYNMEGDGYTLDDKRDADPEHNDIPDILERWAHLGEEEQRDSKQKSFLVPKQEIVDNDYDFSFNKYVETEYERVEYPPTSEILNELDELNRQMADGLAELRAMLGGESND